MVLLVLCLDLCFLGVRRFPPPGAAGAGAGEVSGPRFLDAVPANFNPRAHIPGWEAPEDPPLLDHRGVLGVALGEGPVLEAVSHVSNYEKIYILMSNIKKFKLLNKL